MTEINETSENITSPAPVQSNGMSNKLFLTLLGVLGLILACALFYFFYWIKTPTYAVGMIKTAIEKKDMTTFEKHVDLESILNKAFIDSTRADMTDPESDESKKILAMAEMQKSKFAKDMKASLLEEIKSTENKASSDFALIEYRGTGTSKVDGNTATVDIKIFNKKLTKEFTLTLGMEKSPDGTWKVVRINNLPEYQALENQSTYEKLLEVNKDNKAEIAKEIEVGKITLSIAESKDTPYSHLLTLNIPLTFLTDRNATTIQGIITIYKGDKLIAFFPLEPIKGSSNKGKTVTLPLTLPLSSFLAKDNLLITTPADQLTASLNITFIEFVDKSKLELDKKIPDPVK